MLYVDWLGLHINVYAQIVGFVGMIVLVWSYQLKKTGFLALSSAAMAIFLAES